MGWFTWLRGTDKRHVGASGAWRRAWTAAAESPSAHALEQLRTDLRALESGADDLEIEHEMLAGMEELVGLMKTMNAGGAPVIATGHRVVGRDVCHFSAPATLDVDGGGASGTFLLTATRAVFVGGSRTLTLPWHGVAAVARQDRDLLISRGTGGPAHRVRCNTYGDALRGAFLARHLRAHPRV
jgi:hypothetical protein